MFEQPNPVRDAADRLDIFYDIVDKGSGYIVAFDKAYNTVTYDWDLVDKDQELVCRHFLNKPLILCEEE